MEIPENQTINNYHLLCMYKFDSLNITQHRPIAQTSIHAAKHKTNLLIYSPLSNNPLNYPLSICFVCVEELTYPYLHSNLSQGICSPFSIPEPFASFPKPKPNPKEHSSPFPKP